MAITAKEVNKLRQMTGAGMMDCKKALVEADGDFEKAIEFLRKKGQKVSASRADRATTEGIVVTSTSEDLTSATIIGLGCETDFVAKNEDFIKLANDILSIAVSETPSTVEELKAAKFGDLTLGEHITEMVGRIGEKLEITAFEVLTGERIVPYIHAGSKLGVLVALSGANGTEVSDAGKDVAMQIAAMRPIAVDRSDVSEDVISKELEIGREQAREEGKPENILDKIAEGKVNKFLKENTLLNQAFVKNNKQTIAQYLKEVHEGLTVSAFKRVSIG